MARHDRTIRLETVKRVLATSRRGVVLKSLAEEHGWPLRTLYRDLEALELAGYNVNREDGRHRMENPGPSLPAGRRCGGRCAGGVGGGVGDR